MRSGCLARNFPSVCDSRATFCQPGSLLNALQSLDEAGQVVKLVVDAQPCNAEPCPRFRTSRPARAVLDMAAGSAAAPALEEGSRIGFDRVSGFPVSVEE